MKTLRQSLCMALFIGMLFGCSDVGFRSLPSETCTNFNNIDGQSCQLGANKNVYTVKFHTGEVDILIVNDNSSSMSPEQARMANSFPNFLNSISHLYYRIGMITTDVSASKNNNVQKAANGFGAFQDGRLLEFIDENKNKSGEYYLTPSTQNLVSKFRGTIKRDETLHCDANGYVESECPSGDERGTYALNLAVNRNEMGFFRAGAHLAVVVLSDEDVRSRTLQNGQPYALPGYELESLDLPETLVENLAIKFPSKTVSFHSVIVPPSQFDPGSNCLSSQTYRLPNGNLVRGSVGTAYAELARPSLFNPSLLSYGNLVDGVIGSICAPDYGAQLGDIGSHIADNARTNVIQMPCTPEPNDINVTPAVHYTVDSDNRLIFTNLPIGVEVTVTYLCPAHI